MTTSKSVNAYPFEFMELIEKFHQDIDKEITIEFPSDKDAMTCRLNFNSFRTALIKKGENQNYRNLEGMSLSVKTNPPRIVITHKDRTVIALAIRKALDKME
jgi:hypothetical protein